MLKIRTIEQILTENETHHCPPKAFGGICVSIVAIAELPTRFGNFQVVAFYNDKDKKEHTMIVKGDIRHKTNVPVRMHSECLTGDALGSYRCDCRDQLITSLKYIGKKKYGAIMYLRQEGRGIGFINKIRAYALQDRGYDTVEADQALGFSGDERDYDVASHMLHSLKVKSVKLMTNNPKKLEDLVKHGTKVTGRIPLVIPANKYNKFYLETKQNKAGHLLDRRGNERMEQEELVRVRPVKKK